MQRLRCPFAIFYPTLVVALALGVSSSGELIHPPGGRAYPELAGAITGTQNYTYDPAKGTGTFQSVNTPFLLATGPSTANETIIQPDAEGIRSQVVNLTLDREGRLLGDPNNSYTLYGTVVIGGRTFQGLLLKGTPTAFGAQGGSSAAFNLDMKVTGGALASAFGTGAYLELHPAVNTRFDGSFAKSFTTRIDSSDTKGKRLPQAAVAPEPSALAVLLACGAAILIQRRRRFFPPAQREPAE